MAKKKNKVLVWRYDDADVENSIDGEILQYVQIHRGKTWRQIAELMGVSSSHVSRVKDGKKHLTLRRVVKLAKGLNVPLPSLLLEVIQAQSGPKKLKKGDKILQNIWQQSAEMSKREPEVDEDMISE